MASVVQASPKYTESWAAFGMTAEFGTRQETALYLQWKMITLASQHLLSGGYVTVCDMLYMHSSIDAKSSSLVGMVSCQDQQGGKVSSLCCSQPNPLLS